MYGGWMCVPPMEYLNHFYTECMRFLPGDEWSNTEDVQFETGPIRVMTYLTSRAESYSSWVGNNETQTQVGESEETEPQPDPQPDVMVETEEVVEPAVFDPDSSAVGSVNGNNASGNQNGAM